MGVVVPTVGRIESLRQCLAVLREAAGPHVRQVVVVVDDAQEGDLVSAAVRTAVQDACGEHLEWSVLPAGRRLGAGACRNLGASIIEAGYLCFLDDDVLVRKPWATAVTAAMGAGRACVTGPVTSTEDSVVARARELRYRSRYATLGTGQPVGFLAGGNSLVRSDVFQRAGGFPDLPVGSDSALVARLVELGETCTFEPSMVVSHRHDRGLRAALRNAWGSGRTSQNGVRADWRGMLAQLRTRAPLPVLLNLALLLVKSLASTTAASGRVRRPRMGRP